jgi:protein-L-isoaspartate(D-aspartate) O-methyltransferase
MDSRKRMVEVIGENYNLEAPGVLSVMLRIPREYFIPKKNRHLAYEDEAVSVGYGQTISQPYTVAFMTSLLDLTNSTSHEATRDKKVLEVGTGSGYQAAILSLLAKKVYTIERIPALAKSARKKLKKLGYGNVEVRQGSGEEGWKEKAPFDAILVTAGMRWVPEELFRELKSGGVLVVPLGSGQDKVMVKYIKKGRRFTKKEYGTFHFVPFIEG